MKFQNITGIIISSVLASVTFIVSAFLASIVGNMMLIISPIGYGFILINCLKSTTKSELAIKELIIILLTAIFVFCSYHFELFSKVFIALFPSYGQPNAGSGFVVLFTIFFNSIISIIMFIVYFFIGKMTKNNIDK